MAFLLHRDHGLDLPKAMHPEVGAVINQAADQGSRELESNEIHTLFLREYVQRNAPLQLIAIEREDFAKSGEISIEAEILHEDKKATIRGTGNGPISAFVDALQDYGLKDFQLMDYRQHSIGHGSKTEAAAYIQIKKDDGSIHFGCGINANIEVAGSNALVSAFNRSR